MCCDKCITAFVPSVTTYITAKYSTFPCQGQSAEEMQLFFL